MTYANFTHTYKGEVFTVEMRPSAFSIAGGVDQLVVACKGSIRPVLIISDADLKTMGAKAYLASILKAINLQILNMCEEIFGAAPVAVVADDPYADLGNLLAALVPTDGTATFTVS